MEILVLWLYARFVSVIIIYDGSPTATKNLTELSKKKPAVVSSPL